MFPNLPCVCGDVRPILEWPAPIGTFVKVYAVSSKAAIRSRDDGAGTEAPKAVWCVDPAGEAWSSYSSYTSTVEAASRDHVVMLRVRRHKARRGWRKVRDGLRG